MKHIKERLIIGLILAAIILPIAMCNAQTSCNIQKDTDKFTDQVSIKTQVATNLNICPLIFGALVKKADTSFYLHFYLRTNSGTYGANGVYVIFEDGEKWVREDAKINVEYERSGVYSYQSFLYLSKADIDKLRYTRVTDIRVHTTDFEYPQRDADFFRCGVDRVLKEIGK